MAERRRRPRHRPRLAPPRAAPPPAATGLNAQYTALRRAVRPPLDALSARFKKPKACSMSPRAAATALIWRAPFWLWIMLAFFTAFPFAAPSIFALLGFAVASIAAFRDFVSLRALTIAGLHEVGGAPAPDELRWIAAVLCFMHGIVAGVVALVAAVPALIGLLGGYAW